MKDATRAGVMVMTAVLRAQPEKREELSQTLQSLVARINDQPGCLECLAGQDLGGDSQFFLYLVWENLGCMEAYMASEGFRVLLGASSTLAAPTNFRFTMAHGSSAMARPAPNHGPARPPSATPNIPGQMPAVS